MSAPLPAAPDPCLFCDRMTSELRDCYVIIDVPQISQPFGQSHHTIAFPCRACAICAGRIDFAERASFWVGVLTLVITLSVAGIVWMDRGWVTAVDWLFWIGIASSFFSFTAVRLIVGRWGVELPKAAQDHALAMSRKYLKYVTPTISLSGTRGDYLLVEPLAREAAETR